MAIKTSPQGSLPAVTLDYIQYSSFRMSISEKHPFIISISGVIRPYGVSGGDKYYAKDIINLQIPNLDTFIANLPPAKTAVAAEAMIKVQEGLGELAAAYLDTTFVGVE